MNIPTGNITFLFTDIEGSTKLAQNFPDTLQISLEKHYSILRNAIESNNGFIFEIVGDAFCAAFDNAYDGVKAAYDAQIKLNSEKWSEAQIKIRIGIHSGNVEWNGTRYMGYITLARAQRVMSVAYGGQILISNDAFELAKEKFQSAAADKISIRDLGERRLQDLIQPMRLYQITSSELPSDFPQLKTLDARPNNLPIQLTSFIGRKKEMVEVKNLLKKTHLLTIVGSGGTGKTRLLLQVGADIIDDFAHGVWIVELAQLSDPNFILQEIASVLSLKEDGKNKLINAIIDFLREKELLLILDNCEHLINECAKLSEALLRSCHKLKILASSREILRVDGETTYRIPSLSIPDIKVNHTPKSLMEYESVILFIDRAASVEPGFNVTTKNAQAIVQICYNLNGIPFAIELAAARVYSLPAEKIAERLNDRFHLLTGGSRAALPRQQTLRAMIDWSYSLLTETEKAMLRRMSVFPEGMTLETAEDTCSGGNIKTEEVLNLLGSLVNKSLVVAEESTKTYRLPETVRLYGIKKLIEFDKQIIPEKIKFFQKNFFVDRIKSGKKTLNYLKNKKSLLLISAFLFLTIILSLYEIDSGINDIIVKGDDAYKKFTYKEAIYYYTQFLNNNMNSETYRSRAKVFNDMYYFDEAVKDLDKSIELENENAESYYLRAYAKNYLGDLGGSLEDFNKSIALKPDYLDAYIGRANLYGNNVLSNYKDETITDYDKSISDFNEVLKKEPDNIEAILFLGFVYGKKYEYWKERDLYMKAANIEPKNYKDLLNRSIAFYKLFRYNESLTDLSKAMEQNPTFIKGYFSRGDVLKDMCKYNEAIMDCNKLASLLKSKSFYFYFNNFNIGRIYDLKKDSTKAKGYYTQIKEFKPKFTKEYLLKAETFCSLNEWDSSIQVCKSALDKEPRNAEVIVELLSSKFNSNEIYKRSAILNILNDAFKDNLDNAQFWFAKSKYNSYDSNFNQALEDISTAIEINPYNAEYYKVKSVYYYHLGKYNFAVTEITKAIDKNPFNLNYYDYCFEYNYLLNNYHSCIDVSNKGIGLNLFSDKMFYNRSRIYFKMYKSKHKNNEDYFETALEDADKAIGINQYNPFFYQNRGSIYYESKNYIAAIDDWEYMIKLDKSFRQYVENDLIDAKRKLASLRRNLPLLRKDIRIRELDV